MILSAAIAADSALTSQTVPALLRYLNGSPDIEFSYKVKTGYLANKTVSYVRVGNRFAYRWIDDKTGRVVKMYAYDGKVYYSLHNNGYLTLSKAVETDAKFGRTWLSFNPQYNVFKYLVDLDPLTLENLQGPEAIGYYGNLFAKGVTETVKISDPKRGQIEYRYKDRSLPFPTEIKSTDPMGSSFVWKIEKTIPLPTVSDNDIGPASKIPAAISCRYMGRSGRLDPYSYEIRIDESSVRAPTNVSDETFRVPLSAVETAFDLDRGIYLKKHDWSE